MIELKVLESMQQDTGRGIGRIDSNTMQELGISSGDVIKVKGERTTAVIVWPSFSEDEGKGIIRIDGFTRKNAGVQIDDRVAVDRAEVKKATYISFEPTEVRINVDEEFTNFVKNSLMERVFLKSDATVVVAHGFRLAHPIPLVVTKTVPEGFVKIVSETQLQLESGAQDKELLELQMATKGFSLEKRENTVMTRLSDEDLKQVDILIGIGLFDSRSEVVAYLTHEGIIAKKEMFDHLSGKLSQIEKIRSEAQALLTTSTSISSPKKVEKNSE
jgi:hypothetical protein